MYDGGVQYDGLVHYITQDNWKKLEKILYYCILESQELNKREFCLYFVNIIDECPEFHIFKLHFVLMHYLALTKMIWLFVIRPKCSIWNSLGRIWQILKIESSNSFIQKGEGTLTLVFIYLRIWPRTSTTNHHLGIHLQMGWMTMWGNVNIDFSYLNLKWYILYIL